MTSKRAYLDHNASAPLRDSARATMVEVLNMQGNASSVHGEGRSMRMIVERARKDVAALVGAETDGVVFTGSATEAAHLALTPEIYSDGVRRPAGQLYVLETEHPCILAAGRFAADQITKVPVQSNGVVDEAALVALLEAHDETTGVPYLAIQLVNSETGVIQPVTRVAQNVRFKGGYVLCDAVQAAGRMPIDIAELGVDFLILSAHKLGGPQGIGALVIAHQILTVTPAIGGGGQEKNRRAGTENVAAIAGFGVAAKEAATEAQNYERISALRDSIESCLSPICASNGIAANRLTVFGHGAERAGNTVLFSVDGLKAETAVIAFDLDGCAVSSGSACSSGKVGRSHVLAAMGIVDEIAWGAIRISVGWNSSEDDVTMFTRSFEKIAKRLAEMVPNAVLEEELSGAA